jgi:glycerol uptake facilitator-like aquaporin
VAYGGFIKHLRSLLTCSFLSASSVGANIYSSALETGAMFNPAVATAVMMGDWLLGGPAPSQLWLYILAPFLGALVAVVVYRIEGLDESDD